MMPNEFLMENQFLVLEMGATQQFSLRWNNYIQHITCAFGMLRLDEDLVDVTLSCEGKRIYAHKMLLSACSNYFKDVFKENPCKHPVIIFRNVKFEDLLAIIDFMYHGEVNVEQEQLPSFLTTAEMLAVEGLTGATKDEPPIRKRPPPLIETGSSPVQDLSFNRQSNNKLPSRPLGTQNPPTAASNPSPLSPRPHTPVSKKRRLSPPAKPSYLERDGLPKRKVTDAEPLVPKSESDDLDEEGSFCEQDNIMEDVKLELSSDFEAESPSVKAEASPTAEVGTEKTVGGELKPGPSASAEAQGFDDLEEMDEEYLDTDSEETLVDADGEGQLAYVLMGADGEFEVIDPSALLDKDTIVVSDLGKNIVKEEMAFFVGEHEGIEEDDESGRIEYIYAEGINDKNEIIIGEIPNYACDRCDRTFKRLDSLRKHLSLHEGRTVCPVCSSVFSRVAHLTRHMRVKHPDLEIVGTGRRRRT